MNVRLPIAHPAFFLTLVMAGLTAVGISLVGAEESGKKGLAPGQTIPTPPLSTLPSLGFEEKELFGGYYLGDGLGVNCSLTLRADHRFTFSWRGCLGEYDRNEGSWSLEGDVVVMKPERPNKAEGFRGMNVRFVPIKWGPRLYLIDENETPGFCAAARESKFASEGGIRGHDYVKRDGGKRPPPATGKPIIPERYREYYEKGQVVAKVVKLQPDGRVLLDKGSVDRLKPGMLMSLNAFGRIELKVTGVQERQATAEVFYFWNSGEAVKVGSEFTTGGYWHRPWGTGHQRLRQLPARASSKDSA